MSSQPIYPKVIKRKPLHKNNLAEVNQSGDIDDEMYTFEEEHDSSKSLNISTELSSQSLYDQESPKPYNRNRKDLSSNRTVKNSPFREKSSKTIHKDQNGYIDERSNSKCGGTVLLFIVILLIAVWIITTKSEEKRCSFETLRKKYTDQDFKMWQILSSGVENILRERTKNPGVYLFLHNDSRKMKSIVKEIATETSHCFGKFYILINK